MTFNGFSAEAIAFYRDLESDNTKQFWTAHKKVYDAEVAAPMAALLADVEPEFGPGKMFRPYRDVRFSPDKTPYKTSQGAIVGPASGIGFYVHIDGDGLLTGAGWRAHSSEQIDRYRAAVASDEYGPSLVGIVAGLRDESFEIDGDRLKTRPKGYPADHPRLDLLRHKDLFAIRRFGQPDWLGTPEARSRIQETWRTLRPLSDWVAAHVAVP